MAGAGKTTLARRIERESGAMRFSPDEWLLSLMADVDDRAEMDRLRPGGKPAVAVARDLLAGGLDTWLDWLERPDAGELAGYDETEYAGRG
jgi:hypothetical protein